MGGRDRARVRGCRVWAAVDIELDLMSVVASLPYTEAIVRAAAVASWRRAFGIRFVIALCFVVASLCYLVARGDRSWLVGVLAASVAIGAVFPAVYFFVSLRTSLRKLAAMHNPEANFRADAESFSISSELGSATLPWSSVQQLWRYQDFWIIVLSKTSQLTVPLARLTQADRSFVVSRVAANGGKVGK